MRLRALPLVLFAVALPACHGGADDTGAPDLDGDGVEAGADCDDTDPTRFPGADEVCDDVDNDCDDAVDEAAVDARRWRHDVDGDGYGDSLETGDLACEAPVGKVDNGRDCDDRDPDVRPTADEVCDGVDNNCDGAIDGDDAVDATTWYPDADGDGYGDSGVLLTACEAPTGYVSVGGDCDDAEPAAWPGADEVCDDIDNDCDGRLDDEDPDVDRDTWRSFWPDRDGDGYGVIGGARTTGCAAPSGYAPSQDDCDDRDASVNPGAADVWYDGVDSDCDGASDYDADGDGYDADDHGGADCDDHTASVNPGAVEVWYDGVDGDCDGFGDYDADADGFEADAYGGTDCDETDPDIHPYAWEDDTDGLDNDCDGGIDALDPDPVTTLSLSDDSFRNANFSAFSFPFCGDAWTRVRISANGLLTFDYTTEDDTESAAEFAASGVAIAALWDDLYPDWGGSVSWVEYPDAVGIYYNGVFEIVDRDTPNTFAAVLLGDGRVLLKYGALGIPDGLAGWSCGTDPSATEVDLSDWDDHPVWGSAGLGQGTESAFFEVFTSADNDLDGRILMLCGTAGTDSDGDGWTDTCGDPDDTDASVVP
ncbi:MAG: putative metal-binding motif-containing protein [Alphaproteobacteria bacterium]|nr:putative metal-binding motif-containing protein [Alphaproteobacteria bacterium]